MPSLTRRDFMRNAAFAAAGAQLATSLFAEKASPSQDKPVPTRDTGAALPMVRWLDQAPPALHTGTTWGMPWPRGLHAAGTSFALTAASGRSVPVQSWPLATWPDGSLKWTAHAVPAGLELSEQFAVSSGVAAAPEQSLRLTDAPEAVQIDTGVMVVKIARKGSVLVTSVSRAGREVLRNGRLVLLCQDNPETSPSPDLFTGQISAVTVEQSGPVRALVKIEGRHAAQVGGRAWLPFVVRLYFYAGAESIRVLHTFVHDGDEHKDFIRGIGLRFDVPMRGELHDRHVRFSGEADGLFGEAVRTVTGLRRDPGAAVKAAQIAGLATPPVSTWAPAAGSKIHYVPAFGDWSLFQSSADGFEIRKRTKPGFTWISSARGQRAGGLAYVGTPQGGVAAGIRNFWQSHPSELEILGAAGEVAELTAWLWSPRAGAMDLRGYHDGTGADTHPKQLEAMEITYEDYEPGFDKPDGVARTSELFLWALEATPSRERLARMGELVRTPPVLMATPAYLHSCAVFGSIWSPEDRSTPARAAIEEQLAWNFRFYETQREQRRWYGFWNYGDVMHSYDADRHEWRYDVGGFAWDNSELSTDIWLWLYFLRTGRADVFRFAEAMTRHTGEVDVHHAGRFAPLGSRHSVLHWGCSAKQLRISTAANRRYYYYLTGDERVGDLMREQVDAARALATIQANRKVAPDRVTAPDPKASEVYAGFGTDWGAISAAWLTEWERTGDPRMRDRLLGSMRSIAAQPRGFFTGGARLQLATGAFARSDSDRITVSHLSAVFGLVEVCAELVQLFDEPAFRQAWLDYCVYYNAPAAQQAERFGKPFKGVNLQQGHSRLTAFAARLTSDKDLASRAWKEFYGAEGSEGRGAKAVLKTKQLSGTEVLRPLEEAPWMSTNGTAQWGLAAIQCLALVGEQLPRETP